MLSFIKKVIIKLYLYIVGMMPSKYIFWESQPIHSDNAFAVYKYIKDNNLLSQYEHIWYDSEMYQKKPFLYRYYLARSKAVIFCNNLFSKARKNQLTVNLCHGSKTKKTRGKYEAPKDLDYILVQADVFKEAMTYEYNLSDHTKMITLGYPRNDDLLNKSDITAQCLFKRDFKKLIIWYPTFRQHKNGSNYSSVTIPIVHNDILSKKLNECAKKNDVLIVLKPHFAQDVSFIKKSKLSNIMIINDDFLVENKIRSYQMLSMSDALLTDYSSIYYDYLLVDKPIGMVWEDYDEYKKNQGFALDPDMIYQGGEKIFNIDDFCDFVERIAQGKDILQKERNKIKDITNVYKDNQSSKRVGDFIVNKINGCE
ncbi:MAG: CDP-glycerol glycerophosphotransferase family protein [Clostridia bacterium]|nr:CDP-glycerol glycerophosphotransferase family protein [Clostridia bacterium]